jgi:hypothetical protein
VAENPGAVGEVATATEIAHHVIEDGPVVIAIERADEAGGAIPRRAVAGEAGHDGGDGSTQYIRDI